MIFRLYCLTFLVISFFFSCSSDNTNYYTPTKKPTQSIDYKQEMRNFVINISEHAKKDNPDFYVIPQNALELISISGKTNSSLNYEYLNAIDGHGQESLNYGYYNDNEETPQKETTVVNSFLSKSQKLGNKIFVTDYCFSPEKVTNSYLLNNEKKYAGFVAIERALNIIPNTTGINNENNLDIKTLSECKNFLYILNSNLFKTKADFINAISKTNYDLLIIDAFFAGSNNLFTKDDIERLRKKENGGSRLVIAYMSIGEAEDYRFYWNKSWLTTKPKWLDKENPIWKGNYKVHYWEKDWQQIIYGNKTSYLSKIMTSNFDGIYLDLVDAYLYYE